MQSQTEQNIFSTKHTERSALYRKPVGDNSLIPTNLHKWWHWIGHRVVRVSKSLRPNIFMNGTWDSFIGRQVRLRWNFCQGLGGSEGCLLISWPLQSLLWHGMDTRTDQAESSIDPLTTPVHLWFSGSIAWRGRSLCETNYSCYNRTGQLSKSIKMVS